MYLPLVHCFTPQGKGKNSHLWTTLVTNMLLCMLIYASVVMNPSLNLYVGGEEGKEIMTNAFLLRCQECTGASQNVIVPLPTYPGDYFTLQGRESNIILH